MFKTLISTAELAARLGAPDLVVVDVRHELTKPAWGEEQFRAGHIPRAAYAHLDRDLSGPTTGTNGRHPLPSVAAAAATFGRLGIDATKQVVAYDQGSGAFAARLWWMLHWLGHEAAAVLDGGFAQWTREGRPIETAVTAPRATSFVARPDAAHVVDAAAVAAALGSEAMTLIDARSPERYRGDVEPLDRVPGHIPGARNRPYAANLSAAGTFKPAAELRAEFDAVLGGKPVASVVHQCGSGVTACHNALAMAIAGLPALRLYPGSWSEWCADPSRPVARGS